MTIMRVLITGSSGFLGSALCSLLPEKAPFEIIRGERPVLELTDTEKIGRVLSFWDPDAIVHTAALSSPDRCELEPDLAWQVNSEATARIVDWTRANDRYLVHLSTDLVFDGNEPAPAGFTESHDPKPNSVYARSKRAAENSVLSGARSSGAAVLRSALIYGPSFGSKLGPFGWMHTALAAKRAVTLFDDEWRTPVALFDLVDCIALLVQRKPEGVFHCGGASRVTRQEMGQEYCRVFGFDPALIEARSRLEHSAGAVRPEDVSLNCESTKSELGLDFRSFRVGLEHLHDWCAAS